jgi:alpha-tubulin suppressor-like RCC1 family protein
VREMRSRSLVVVASFASLFALACVAAACGVTLEPKSSIEPDGDGGGAGDGGGILSPITGDGGEDGASPLDDGPERAIEISPGGGLSCARTSKGRVFCWGVNARNVIGPAEKEMPCRVPSDLQSPVNRCIAPPFSMGGGLDKIVKVGVGRFHACAIRADGTVACFGSNESGGIGMANTDMLPHAATDLVGVQKAVDVSLGFHASCLLRTSAAVGGPNEVWCWGIRDLGLMGTPPLEQQGGQTQVLAPQRNPKLDGAKMVRVSRDYPNACAIDKNDEVVCWGVNHRGILGHPEGQNGDRDCFLGFGGGAQKCTPDPQPIAAGVKVKDLAVGSGYACAIAKDDDRIVCWGRNDSATLGLGPADGNSHTSFGNVMMMGVGVLHATSISTTWNHVCAMTIEKGPVCWGANNNRQLGPASGVSVCGNGDCSGPRQIPAADPLDTITAGWETSYFRAKATGAFTAMGNNDFAQLGHPPNSSGDIKCSNDVACAQTPLPLTFTF